VRSLFVRDGQSPYELLGLSPASTDDEIRARHRQIARENHPDRLIGRGLSAEFIAAAERHLAAVNAAFDIIARERGL
jgi:DnaJ like chaperone protein